MKILHVVAGDLSGGAARGAYWLHQGLLSIGVESYVLVQKGYYTDPSVFSLENTSLSKILIRVRSKMDRLPLVLYKNRQKTPFSTGIFGNNIKKHSMFVEADIIHLHWINGGMINFKKLKTFNKPIVWTMRDMWPFTGGCHYSLDCDNFKKQCGACPQLKSDLHNDLSRWVLKRKNSNIPKDLYPVAISNWLGEEVRNSTLFSNFKVRVIPNCIDMELFKPIEKMLAKKILNLPLNKQTVLVGAKNVHDSYKGFPKFIESVNFIKNKDLHFAFFGKTDKTVLDELNISYIDLGSFTDELSLSLVYSAADVFVAPSIQEAFGKTLVESMACETPVVAFNATGPKDIVAHKQTGYLAKPFEPEDLARGIEWVLEDEKLKNSISQKAREKAVECFEIKKVAKQYLKLYKEVLDSKV
jgi:glycosyltransferase involved in cell wall biosynthesis